MDYPQILRTSHNFWCIPNNGSQQEPAVVVVRMAAFGSAIPKQDGVYIVKTNQEIDRLQGQSDVVKIGQGRLFNRIKAYENPKREVFGSPDNDAWKKRGTARRMRQFWLTEKFPTMITYFSMSDAGDIQAVTSGRLKRRCGQAPGRNFQGSDYDETGSADYRQCGALLDLLSSVQDGMGRN